MAVRRALAALAGAVALAGLGGQTALADGSGDCHGAEHCEDNETVIVCLPESTCNFDGEKKQ